MSLLDQLVSFKTEFVEGGLSRAYANLSPTGYWYISYAKDKYGRLIIDIHGNPIFIKAWVEPQEGKSDYQVFWEICYEELVRRYNRGRLLHTPTFDERTVNIYGLCRDYLKLSQLEKELSSLNISLFCVKYYGKGEEEYKKAKELYEKKQYELDEFYRKIHW